MFLMTKLTEKEKANYRVYENLDTAAQKRILKYIGADIGANVGRFDIPKTIVKKLIAKRVQMVIDEQQSLQEYIKTLEMLRGDK